jgi:hypothetical protein
VGWVQVCGVYNPKDPHVIVSGLYNGQLCYWDSRKSTKAIDTSPIENSHRDPVYDICWLQVRASLCPLHLPLLRPVIPYAQTVTVG